MRVLIQTACYCVIDGVSTTIRKLETFLLANGHHVAILTTSSGQLSNLNIVPPHPNRSIIFMNAFPLPVMAESGYKMTKRLSSQNISDMNDFNPTVIHVTVPDLCVLDVLQYAIDTDTPLIATWHSNYIEYMDYYEASWIKTSFIEWNRHTFSFVPKLFVPTPFIKDSLSSSYYQLHQCTELHIWGRGVDCDKFSPKFRSTDFRSSHSISPDDVAICFAGRLVTEKHCAVYCDVIRKLNKTPRLKQRVVGVVIGEGAYFKEMSNLPNTVATGWLNNEALSTAYASCDVFLFPSGSETFGNVTLEACASGLPIVVEKGCSR